MTDERGQIREERDEARKERDEAEQRHHNLLDGRQQPRIVVRCLTPDGADGPISVELK